MRALELEILSLFLVSPLFFMVNIYWLRADVRTYVSGGLFFDVWASKKCMEITLVLPSHRGGGLVLLLSRIFLKVLYFTCSCLHYAEGGGGLFWVLLRGGGSSDFLFLISIIKTRSFVWMQLLLMIVFASLGQCVFYA